MGYNSTWSGYLTPSRRIPERLVTHINDLNYDICVLTAPMRCTTGGEPGDVVPRFANMAGSNVAHDICRVQKILDEKGIRLTGEIFRAGDDNGDFEKIEVVGGNVFSRSGKVRYGKRDTVTTMRWSVRVDRITKSGKRAKFGWVVASGDGTAVAFQDKGAGKVPWVAARFERKADARKAAKRHTDGRHTCEIVETEALR